MPYRIKAICPKGTPEIELGQLTVLVGPNNSGKSQTLRDIREFTSSGNLERLVVLTSISSTLPSETELKEAAKVRPHDTLADHLNVIGVKDDLLSQISFGPHKTWFDQVYAANADALWQAQEILRALGTCLIAYLGAEARFRLTESSAAFNPRSESPSNALQSLYAADAEVMAELRRAFRAAFDMDIGLDWAAMTRLYLRVAKDFYDIPDTRLELDALMSEAEELQKQGDGFRSFTGIALALLTYPNRTILLDEPEAFLHPSQARVLGRWVAKQASRRLGQVIVATHSADFLAGLIGAGEKAKILRLSRTGTNTHFHEIPSSVTVDLVESPLLSSQPILDSMFHRGAVICEGDPDRAVYQTVAHRFCADQLGEEFLFIHSNGKDAAKSPAELLRKSGTPVCVIADFDVLNSEKTLVEIIEGLTGREPDDAIRNLRASLATVVEARSQEQSVEDLRASVTAWLDHLGDLRKARKDLVGFARQGSNKWNHAKKAGVLALPESDRPMAHDLIARLASVGLFVVPCGELESWIDLGVPKGKRWNRQALQELHESRVPRTLNEFVQQVLAFLLQVKMHEVPRSTAAIGPV